jgi:anti-anti-sigma regulatory factor
VGDAHGEGWTGDRGPTTTRVGRALVVTLPRELDDGTLRALRTDVLERVRRERVRSVVFEASGLDVIDAQEFRDLTAVARTAAWLGVRPLLVGLSAGIVGYVVDAGLDASAFTAFGTLEDALAALAREADGEATTTSDDRAADGGAPGAPTADVEP